MFVSNGTAVTTKTPISLTQDGYFPWMPPMSGGWPSAYSGIYSQQLWVYVVVTKRAQATARLPLPVYDRDALNRPRNDTHPMAALLARPNPALTPFELWEWTSSTFDIYGETFWFKQRQAGRVVGLYPFHPTAMSYVDDKRSWTFDNGKRKIEDIAEGDVVHFRGFNPESMTRGMSPLEPLRATLENEWSARTATSSFWKRGARPGTYLMHKGVLSQPAADRLKVQFDTIAAGTVHTGSTVVLEEGMEPKPMMLTAEEAQYIETRKLNREEVCAAYHMPPPAVQILDRATFSNITEQFRSVYRDTMAPHLRRFEAAIERDLRQAEFPDDEVYAEFLMDEVLRGDFETRQDALNKATHMTIAEKRKIENLPFIEGTDRIFLNLAEQPMPTPQDGDAPAAPPFQQVGLPALIEAGVITREDARRLLGIDGTTPTVPDVPAIEPVALAAPTARSIMGRLGWQRQLAEVDLRALIDGCDQSAAGAVLEAFLIEKANEGDVESLRKRIRALVKE